VNFLMKCRAWRTWGKNLQKMVQWVEGQKPGEIKKRQKGSSCPQILSFFGLAKTLISHRVCQNVYYNVDVHLLWIFNGWMDEVLLMKFYVQIFHEWKAELGWNKVYKIIIVAREGTFVGVMAFNNEPFCIIGKIKDQLVIHEFSIKSHNRTSSIHPWKFTNDISWTFSHGIWTCNAIKRLCHGFSKL